MPLNKPLQSQPLFSRQRSEFQSDLAHLNSAETKFALNFKIKPKLKLNTDFKRKAANPCETPNL